VILYARGLSRDDLSIDGQGSGGKIGRCFDGKDGTHHNILPCRRHWLARPSIKDCTGLAVNRQIASEEAMDVTNIAQLATTMAATATSQAVGTAVLKKAIDIQASSAAALLEALPPATNVNLPAHLGQHVNTTA
jgi:hypothetical protein